MPEIPTEAVRAALAAIEQELTSRPFDPFFKGDEALTRAVLEAAAPILADQVRREVADQFRAFAARLRTVSDDGLTLGQTWDRDSRAMEYDRLADVIEKRIDA